MSRSQNQISRQDIRTSGVDADILANVIAAITGQQAAALDETQDMESAKNLDAIANEELGGNFFDDFIRPMIMKALPGGDILNIIDQQNMKRKQKESSEALKMLDEYESQKGSSLLTEELRKGIGERYDKDAKDSLFSDIVSSYLSPSKSKIKLERATSLDEMEKAKELFGDDLTEYTDELTTDFKMKDLLNMIEFEAPVTTKKAGFTKRYMNEAERERAKFLFGDDFDKYTEDKTVDYLTPGYENLPPDSGDWHITEKGTIDFTTDFDDGLIYKKSDGEWIRKPGFTRGLKKDELEVAQQLFGDDLIEPRIEWKPEDTFYTEGEFGWNPGSLTEDVIVRKGEELPPDMVEMLNELEKTGGFTRMDPVDVGDGYIKIGERPFRFDEIIDGTLPQFDLGELPTLTSRGIRDGRIIAPSLKGGRAPSVINPGFLSIDGPDNINLGYPTVPETGDLPTGFDFGQYAPPQYGINQPIFTPREGTSGKLNINLPSIAGYESSANTDKLRDLMIDKLGLDKDFQLPKWASTPGLASSLISLYMRGGM